MIYQFPLACAGALILIATTGYVMLHAARGGGFDHAYLGKLILLGLIGGAALTPLIDHLGG